MKKLSTLTLTAFLSLSSSAFSNAEDIGLATRRISFLRTAT